MRFLRKNFIEKYFVYKTARQNQEKKFVLLVWSLETLSMPAFRTHPAITFKYVNLMTDD